MKRDGRKIVGVVAWDWQMAQVVDRAGVDIVSVGDSVGKNLFSNVYRFVDVMRGLNSHLMPMLRKVQRACAGCQHILDAGCGSGLLAFALKCADPGPEIVATDRSRAMSSIVQEKNNTFAGLIRSGAVTISERGIASPTTTTASGAAGASFGAASPVQSVPPGLRTFDGGAARPPYSPASSGPQAAAAAAASGAGSDGAPLVQFVLGDIAATPDRFIIVPAGTNATEVALGGRRQFDVLLCIDVLAFLPSVEAIQRALFNLVMHAKPHAKLLVSVPNLMACAIDAARLSAHGGAGAGAGAGGDPALRPKVQRSLRFEYDRHKLSLGSSVALAHGGVLDVIERQWFDIAAMQSYASTAGGGGDSSGSTRASGGGGAQKAPTSATSASSSSLVTPGPPSAAQRLTTPSMSPMSPMSPKSPVTPTTFSAPLALSASLADDAGVRRVLRRHTEWFGFSCPNVSAGGGDAAAAAAAAAPQIFSEQMEELVLHPTVLEAMFSDMGWKVEEVCLFQALERGGEFATANVNSMALLGAVPGGATTMGGGALGAGGGRGGAGAKGAKAAGAGADADKKAAGDPPANLESQFSHRLYTLSRKSII